MQFTDAVPFSGTRRTTDGYLVVDAKAVRTGIQLYAGHEVGRPDLPVVRVYRSEDEVRSADSLRSFSHAPITVDHPSVPVTAENWRDLSVGEVSTSATWDGNRIALPLILKDAAAIRLVEAGKRELSAGYTCDLDPTPGVTADGQAFDAQQKNIRANHLAIVTRGRAGPECRIGDADASAWGAAPISPAPQPIRDTVPMKMHTVDGHSVELNDAAAIAVASLRDKLATSVADNVRLASEVVTIKGDHAKAIQAKDAELADAKKASETKDGEIVALKKQIDDAKLTPQKLDEAVKARVAVMADAEKIVGKGKITFDGKTEAEIRREAVTSHLGDVAKALSDEAINGAFLSYASKAPTLDHLGRSISASVPAPGHVVGDASAAAYDELCRSYDDAWKRPTHQPQGNA